MLCFEFVIVDLKMAAYAAETCCHNITIM
jgi:hypothetical protein